MDVDEIIHFILAYITALISLMSLASNSFVVFVMIKRKLARDPTFYLLTALIVADLILAFGFLIATICQLLWNHGVLNIVPSQVAVLINLAYVFGTMMDQEITLFIAIDRIVAVAMPLFYKTKTTILSIAAIVFAVCTSLTTVGCAFVNVDPIANTTYTGITAGYSVLFLQSFNAIDLSFCYAIIAFYLILMFLIASRKRNRINDPANMNQKNVSNFAKRQAKLNQFLMAVVLSYIFTTCVGYTIKLVMGFVNASTLRWFTLGCIIRTGNLVIAANTATNVVIYPWKSSELRTALKIYLGFRENVFVAVKDASKEKSDRTRS